MLLLGAAHAFTIETPITRGRHEETTEDVLRETRAALPDTALPLPALADDRALIATVPLFFSECASRPVSAGGAELAPGDAARWFFRAERDCHPFTSWKRADG
jgi:hypothetical protein